MIFEKSRYSAADVARVADSKGELRTAIAAPLYYGTTFTAKKQVIRQGERLEQLAAQHYGDPEMWWYIAVANPEILYPDQITPGTLVRIPDATALR